MSSTSCWIEWEPSQVGEKGERSAADEGTKVRRLEVSPPLANWKWDPQAGPKSVPQYRTCLAAHPVLSLLPILFLHHPPFFVQSTIFNSYISLPRLLQTLSVYALCLSSLENYFLEPSLNRLASLTPGHHLLDARHLDLLSPQPCRDRSQRVLRKYKPTQRVSNKPSTHVYASYFAPSRQPDQRP
ncbi:hypothetical protein NW768_005743 [Fusarium equiseti]|uniref:Uncharacterized protein n=1 Tax=Fusarium equiseti TaxID=61235 RepID=A0ABQ8RDA6_FUSEQ|nr:hypothetical protein NW768_005743 [Fusarium equiseti]